MKIIEEIKQEHDEIREYFMKMENNEEQAPEIFKELATYVLTHHEAEEETVFSELSNKKEVKEAKNALKAEHAAGRRTIQVILDTPDDDPMWEAHVHVLKDILLHHVQEEEEKLFKHLREEKDEKEMEELYTAFENYFKEKKPEIEKKVGDKMIAKPQDHIPQEKKPGKKSEKK